MQKHSLLSHTFSSSKRVSLLLFASLLLGCGGSANGPAGIDGSSTSMASTSSALTPSSQLLPTPPISTPAEGKIQKTVYLSDIVWTSATNGWGPVERDRSNGDENAGDGLPIRVGGESYVKGLGANADSSIKLDLTGDCNTFSAVVGLDDEIRAQNKYGSLIFVVLLDGIEKFNSGVMRVSDSVRAKTIKIAVTGGSKLELKIVNADEAAYDHGDWADAKLECNTNFSVASYVPPSPVRDCVAGPNYDEPGLITGNAAASAGSNVTITLPDTRVNLLGAASGLAANWTQVSGPSNVLFKSTTAPNTAVMADQPGTYVLRLSACDQSNRKTSDVQLVVAPNPIILGSQSTPLDHLKSINRPVFKQGHTMLPLSQYSCGVADPIQTELMKHWGYTGQFFLGDYLGTDRAREILANPGKYPVEYQPGNLRTIYNNYNGADAKLPTLPASTWVRAANGGIYLQADGLPLISPAAPDSVFQIVGDYLGAQAAYLETGLNEPIRIIPNAGEHGLFWLTEKDPDVVYGQDPAVLAAYRASGQSTWLEYISQEKARHERVVKESIFKRLKKGRPFYEWYQEAYGPDRGRWGGWKKYNFLWEKFIGSDGKPLVSDYSSPQMYFKFQNSGWSGIEPDSMVAFDGLTQSLKDAGGLKKLGQKLTYPWVSLGWEFQDSGGISDVDLYIGAMKAHYTAGAIGASVGYFTCTGTREAPFVAAMSQNLPVGMATPTQIKGFYATAQVHALFSHLESFLRDGDLLDGPDQHVYKAGGEAITPAMEFPADGESTLVDGSFGKVKIPTARVVARKMRTADRWLITAWANTGIDRDVQATIDAKLGKLTLKARRAGSVYIAELKGGKVSLTLMDADGMNPTRSLFP
jgi:NPCBM/NEW2 domain